MRNPAIKNWIATATAASIPFTGTGAGVGPRLVGYPSRTTIGGQSWVLAAAQPPAATSRRTLSVSVAQLSLVDRRVLLVGADAADRVRGPFRFDWGDGTATEGFFNQTHVYAKADRDYQVRVQARYKDSTSDQVAVQVSFALVRPPSSAEVSEAFLTVPFRYRANHPNETFCPRIQWVHGADRTVEISGGDAADRVAGLFSFSWGDGTFNEGSFPQRHTYPGADRNYVLKMRSRHRDGTTERVTTAVCFLSDRPKPADPAPLLRVAIPEARGPITSHFPRYDCPANMSTLPDSAFGAMPRSMIEHYLSLGATIQDDLANRNYLKSDGAFPQEILSLSGGYGGSLWFLTPAVAAFSPDAFRQTVPWGACLHEMGHNVTLNMPARYHFGGRSDGPANAIYSETMANLFSLVTCAEMINARARLGIPLDVAIDLRDDALNGYSVMRKLAHAYRQSGSKFASWNDPHTPEDETIPTFMTLVCEFFRQAEIKQADYRLSVKRMCHLLQLWDEGLHRKYSQSSDTRAADAFRASLMVAALSFAFDENLVGTFQRLNFPVDAVTHDELVALAQSSWPRAN